MTFRLKNTDIKTKLSAKPRNWNYDFSPLKTHDGTDDPHPKSLDENPLPENNIENEEVIVPSPKGFTMGKVSSEEVDGETISKITGTRNIAGSTEIIKGRDVEKIETDQEKYISGFKPEYERLVAEGGFGGTIEEFIDMKSEKYKDQEIVTPDSTEEVAFEKIDTSGDLNTEIIDTPPSFWGDNPSGGNWTKKKGWNTTDQGRELLKFTGSIYEDILGVYQEEYGDQMGRRILDNEFRVDRSGKNPYTSFVEMYINNPEKLEEYIRKNVPSLLHEGASTTEEITTGTAGVKGEWKQTSGN